MTGKCSRLRGNRPKAMWGSIVGGLINLGASYLSSRSQAKAMKQQLDAQKELAKEQMLATNQNSLANTLNNYATAQQSYDNQDYNLKYRNGGRKSILRDNNVVITDGGVAQPINDNTFLLRGGSHEDVNETGQTGIGINVGGNQIEAEGGEVVQKKNGALRIFSAQPILSNGMSPAQAILRGYNKDAVFSQQQAFKKRNGLKDDGSKAAFGNLITMPFAGIAKNVVDYFTNSGKYAPKYVKVSNKTVNRKPIRNGQVGNFRIVNGRRITNEKPLRQVYPEFDVISMGRGLPIKRSLKNAVGFVPKPNTFTRGIGNREGIKDLVESKVVRGNPVGTEMTAKAYTKATKSNRNSFNDIMNSTGREGISHRYYNRSLSKEDFDAIQESYNKINTSFKAKYPKASAKIRFAIGDDVYNPLGNYKNYDDYLAQIASDRKTLRNATTINPDNGEPIAYFYNDGRNPLTQGHGYASSKWGVRINHPQDYNMKIFGNHLHYSNSKTIPFDSPNVEVFRSTPFGTIRYPKWMLRRGWYRNGGLTSKDRGSSKRPYPSVSSKDFADGGISYKTESGQPLNVVNGSLQDVDGNNYTQLLPEVTVTGKDLSPHKWAREHQPAIAFRNFMKHLIEKEDSYLNATTPYDYSKDFNRGHRQNLVNVANGFNFRDRLEQLGMTKDEQYNAYHYKNPKYNPTSELAEEAFELADFVGAADERNRKYLKWCAENSNLVNRQLGRPTQGDAWTRHGVYGTKNILVNPNVDKKNYTRLFGRWNVNRDNADYVKDNIDKVDLKTGDIVDLSHAGSSMRDKAFDEGDYNRANSHTGTIYKTGPRKQDTYVLHLGEDGMVMEPIGKLIGKGLFKKDYITAIRRAARKDGSFRNGGKVKYNKPDYYRWMHQTSDNLKVSPIDSTYDYRAYYDSATPWELANTMYNAKNGHFTDIGKRPNHPTFSNESKYSNSKTPGGTWNGDVFVPAIWQFGNDGNGYRNWYMNNTGEGYFDGKHNVYPRSKKAKGGWVKPVYPTVGYHGSKRVRQYIAKAEGSDFAKQNKQFKGDAVGAKELELRNFMGKAYQHLNEGQRDALLSYYYNLTPKTFVNQYKGLRDRLINAQTEQEYNDTINAMKNSINVGWNNAKLPGLRNRRAVERSWFGYVNPTAQQTVNDKVNQIETAPVDNTMVQRPIIIDTPQQEVHVPAGVIPVQNTEPNLFNGDIKQNIIDMGNQFKVKYSCGGTARKKGRLGLASRPVKGMYTNARPKALDGTEVVVTAPNKRKFTDWNNYMTNYGLGFGTTPNVAYQTPNKVNTTVSSNNNLDFSNNNSRLLFGTGDYVSLGADLFSALGSGIINSSAYNGLNFDYDLPGYIDESPVALNTTYHNEAQVANVERNRLNARNSILRNSMSSGSALSRVQSADTNAMYQQNQLFDEKSNKETELRNQNLLNEQQVRARNAAAKNQWLQSVAGIKNSAIAAKNQAQLAKANSLSVGLSGVGQAVNNFISQGRQNYDDEQAMLMGIAASDYATPSRLIDLGVNLSPSTLAGIYRSIANTPNPGDAPKPEDYSSTTEYSIAKNAYDRNIKAYNNRNAYANIIKGRMSLKNRNRYGII